MNVLPPTTEMERAYHERDAAFDGLFVLGVRTTHIFCRPTCPARKPLPKNVEYFATARDALASGYRPCKRCRPMAIDGQPLWVVSLMQDVERNPSARITEADLHRRGIDPATARRYFLTHFGMTFQAYARARRLGQALARIREGATVDDAAFENGYESHSGFRTAFTQALGTTPGKAGNRECISLHWVRSPLGPLIAGATDDAICLLEFADRRMLPAQFDAIRQRFGMPLVPRQTPLLTQLEQELNAYFGRELRQFTVPLSYPGTPFQQRVWGELLRIPYGETRSYEDIARAVGVPGGSRPVGSANGKNRIAIVIPCHRVVNKGGKLGGYGGGLRRKEYLLDLEGARFRREV